MYPGRAASETRIYGHFSIRITGGNFGNPEQTAHIGRTETGSLRTWTRRARHHHLQAYCGKNRERHEYERYLAVEDIDHSRTKTKSPQTNGICERFHKTVLNEFYRVAFRKKVYRSIDELHADLDLWIREYNEQRPHQGRWCFGKTSMQTFRPYSRLDPARPFACGPSLGAVV